MRRLTTPSGNDFQTATGLGYTVCSVTRSVIQIECRLLMYQT